MNEKIIFILLYLAFGSILILVSLFMKLFRKHNEKICTERTLATVIDIERFSLNLSSTNGPRYHPVFQYYANGQQIIKRHPVGTNPPAYKQGQQVELKYNPAKPSQYVIVNSKVAKWVELGLILLGILFIVICGIMFVIDVL